MKFLICGGAGFIGTNFVLYVKNNHPQHKITVVDILDYSSCPKVLAQANINLVVSDISKPNKKLESLVASHDIVINFAAQSHNDNSFTDSKNFVDTNILGTYNLLQLCLKYGKRFHQVSTDEVFGQLLNTQDIFSPQSKYDPTSPYSATKASADMLVMAWQKSFSLPASISYSSNNYGKYQHIEKFIPRCITQCLTGKKPRLYGKGEQIREWIHVEDNCAAIYLIATSHSYKAHMIGSGIEKTNLQVAQAVNTYFGYDANDIDYVSDRIFHDWRYKSDGRQFCEEFSFQPKHTNFEFEIEQICKWYAQNTWFWEKKKQIVEDNYLKQDK